MKIDSDMKLIQPLSEPKHAVRLTFS
jgi:hypothetical protein